MFGIIIGFLQRISNNSTSRGQTDVFQRMRAANHFSSMWFKGFLGETRGVFQYQWNGYSKLKRSVLQDVIITQENEPSISDEELLTLIVNYVDDVLVNN